MTSPIKPSEYLEKNTDQTPKFQWHLFCQTAMIGIDVPIITDDHYKIPVAKNLHNY